MAEYRIIDPEVFAPYLSITDKNGPIVSISLTNINAPVNHVRFHNVPEYWYAKLPYPETKFHDPSDHTVARWKADEEHSVQFFPEHWLQPEEQDIEEVILFSQEVFANE